MDDPRFVGGLTALRHRVFDLIPDTAYVIRVMHRQHRLHIKYRASGINAKDFKDIRRPSQLLAADLKAPMLHVYDVSRCFQKLLLFCQTLAHLDHFLNVAGGNRENAVADGRSVSMHPDAPAALLHDPVAEGDNLARIKNPV